MGEQIRNYTINFIAKTGILVGIGRLFDFSNSYRSHKILSQSDAQALSSDWRAVGNDIRGVMEEYEQK